MNILAISGSLRAASSNTLLLQAAIQLAPPEMELTLYDGLDDLPHFSPDRDGETPPSSVLHLRNLLNVADGVLICTPEYAYGMPGVLKNMLDWTVSSAEFMNKPVATISASPNAGGGERAHASLVLTLQALSAQLIEDGELIVPTVRQKLDAEGHLTDPATSQALRTLLDNLAQAITIQNQPQGA